MKIKFKNELFQFSRCIWKHNICSQEESLFSIIGIFMCLVLLFIVDLVTLPLQFLMSIKIKIGR